MSGDASMLSTGVLTLNTVAVSKGGTGQVTANAGLNALLPTQTGNSGKVLQTNGTDTSWFTAAVGTVTNVTGTLPISVATGTSTPVISMTQSNGTTDGYLVSTDWTIFNAKQNAGSYVTALTGDVTAAGPGSAAATVASVGGVTAVNVASGANLANAATNLNTASTIVKRDASGNFTAGTITANLSGNATTATTATSFSGALVGDVSGNQGTTSVDKIKGKAVSAATAANQQMLYDGTSWINNIMSGDASMLSTGVLTLASTVTAGTYSRVTVDAKGRTIAGVASLDLTTSVSGTLPIANGGTNATSFANTYGVNYYDGTRLLTSAAGSSNQLLVQTVAGPVWTTATFPSTTTANQLLFSSAANTVGGLATANNAMLTTNGSGVPSWSVLATGVEAFLADPTSAKLLAAVTDETGTGALVFATSPTLVTPALGTPASGVATNLTGTAAGLTAGNVTTNANLTGHITSTGNAAVLGSFTSANLATAVTNETGSGALVFGTTPTIATPVINGLATGTGIATANTASTLVARDASGSFSAGTITASSLSTTTVNSTGALTMSSLAGGTTTVGDNTGAAVTAIRSGTGGVTINGGTAMTRAVVFGSVAAAAASSFPITIAGVTTAHLCFGSITGSAANATANKTIVGAVATANTCTVNTTGNILQTAGSVVACI